MAESVPVSVSLERHDDSDDTFFEDDDDLTSDFSDNSDADLVGSVRAKTTKNKKKDYDSLPIDEFASSLQELSLKTTAVHNTNKDRNTSAQQNSRPTPVISVSDASLTVEEKPETLPTHETYQPPVGTEFKSTFVTEKGDSWSTVMTRHDSASSLGSFLDSAADTDVEFSADDEIDIEYELAESESDDSLIHSSKQLTMEDLAPQNLTTTQAGLVQTGLSETLPWPGPPTFDPMTQSKISTANPKPLLAVHPAKRFRYLPPALPSHGAALISPPKLPVRSETLDGVTPEILRQVQKRESMLTSTDKIWLAAQFVQLELPHEALNILEQCKTTTSHIPWLYSIQGFAFARMEHFESAARAFSDAMAHFDTPRCEHDGSSLNRGVLLLNASICDAHAHPDRVAELIKKLSTAIGQLGLDCSDSCSSEDMTDALVTARFLLGTAHLVAIIRELRCGDIFSARKCLELALKDVDLLAQTNQKTGYYFGKGIVKLTLAAALIVDKHDSIERFDQLSSADDEVTFGLQLIGGCSGDNNDSYKGHQLEAAVLLVAAAVVHSTLGSQQKKFTAGELAVLQNIVRKMSDASNVDIGESTRNHLEQAAADLSVAIVTPKTSLG